MAFIEKIFKEDTIIPPKINLRILFYLLIIITACLKQLHGVQQHLDLPFFDETEYLQKGIGLAHHAYNDWGPSYNLWYYTLSQYCHDPVQVFYLNYSILMVLIPIALFLFLVFYGVEENKALLLTLSFLMQPLLVNNFTFVSHFCLLLILAAFIAMAFLRKNESKVLTAMLAAYICMYARQEFLLTFASLGLIWLLLVVHQKKLRSKLSYLVFILSIAVLYYIFGFISFRAQGIDRSLFAFKQHFYTNYIFWTRKILTVDQFDALDIFHGSKTMFQCMLANPAMFAKHIGTNVLNYLINFYKYSENFLLPQPVFHFLGKGKHLLFIGIILYLAYLLIRKKAYKNITGFFQQHPFSGLLIAVFFAWSYFSIFFIFPERHYIILQFCWWIFLLGLLLKHHLKGLDSPFIFYPLVLLLLLFTPSAGSITYYHNMVADAEKQPNLKTISFLRKNNTNANTILFTTERGFNAYLPANYHELFLEQDDVRPYIRNGNIDIQQFLADKQVKIIFMNEKMQKLIKETLGKNGDILLNEPEKMGFKKQVVDPDMQAYLLIKRYED